MSEMCVVWSRRPLVAVRTDRDPGDVNPRTPNVHIRGSQSSQKPPKFHEKTSPEKDKKSENGGGRGKKAQNFGLPTLRGPTLRCRTDCETIETLILAKNGLVNNGLAQNGFGPNWPGPKHDGPKWTGQKWIGQEWSKKDGQKRSRPGRWGGSHPQRRLDGRHRTTATGSQICFAYNRAPDGCATVCPTNRMHVCEFCLEPHRSIECPRHPRWTPPAKGVGKGKSKNKAKK